MSGAEAWGALSAAIASAPNPVVRLPAQRDAGDKALDALQVTPDTTLGALVLHCGGLLVDSGWLRVLGSGHPRLPGSILDWNGLSGQHRPAMVQGALVLAHDLVGGLFAIQAGGLVGEPGHVAWLSPITRRWETLGIGHSAWLQWVLHGDLAGFYNPLRWADWEDEAESLSAGQGIHLWPPPWSGPAWDPDQAERQVVPIEELVQRIFTGRPPSPQPTH